MPKTKARQLREAQEKLAEIARIADIRSPFPGSTEFYTAKLYKIRDIATDKPRKW